MAQNIYIDATAVIIGDVQIGEGASIWPLAVLRGDEGPVVIGEGSNVQDHAVIHVGKIGKNATIGHAAVINNAAVGDNCIIGMNSSILDHAQIGDECIIGANAVVVARTIVPPRSMVVGVPGRIISSDDRTILARAEASANAYHALRDDHLAGRYRRRTTP
jgi:carbonic anhydrase/acetyltransferase-like protein (isoleucine patch superfamily)